MKTKRQKKSSKGGRMKKMGLSIILSGLLAATSFSYGADIYYVKATGGSDANSCLVDTAACATIQGVYNKITAGDTIYVAQGTYDIPNCQIDMTKGVSFLGGYTTDFKRRSTDSALTVFKSVATAGTCRLFSIHTGHTNWVTFDTLKLTGVTNSDSHSGAILTYGIGGLIKFNNVLITGNTMKGGSGAILMGVPLDQLVITNSVISSNTASASGGGINLASGTTGIIDNTKFTSNTAVTFGGHIYSEAKNLTISKSTFTSGSARTGGGVYLKNGKFEISDSSFESNIGTLVNGNATTGDYGSGALNIGNSSGTISRSVFFNNSGTHYGGGVFLDGTLGKNKVTIVNSTFFGNVLTAGAGNGIASYNSDLKLQYSTIYGNKGTGVGAGMMIWDSIGSVEFLGNIILGNDGPDAWGPYSEANIYYLGNSSTGLPKIIDKGYNIIGYYTGYKPGRIYRDYTDIAGVTEPNEGWITLEQFFGIGTTSFTAMTAITPNDIFIDNNAITNDIINPGSYGGAMKSFKLKAVSVARDKIPNTDVPFYGVGKSAGYPFTSIAQAHGALKKYSDYVAGTYYFDLAGSYNAASNYAFTPGANPFTTYVDDEGWVLIASGDKDTPESVYAQVSALTLQTDSILNQTIVAGMQFDEVRINSPESVNYGNFDMVTSDSTIVSEVKAYKVLSNNFDLGRAVWSGSHELNMSSATASDLANGAYGLVGTDTRKLDHNIIGHWGDGAHGFHWQVARSSYEIISYTGPSGVAGNADKDNLNLWVRGSELCNSSVTTTDGRGLHRADYSNPNDPGQYGVVHACDIGAFEYNDGYKFDCYSEDGLRPHNYIDVDVAAGGGTASNQTCFGGDLITATPKALIDNFGFIDSFYMWLLACTGLGLQIKRMKRVGV